MDEFWVFGYGSLMWNPGFTYLESQIGLARGYHRTLCIRSFIHRGTLERPGLVLGLDRGGSCKGVAFRVDIDCKEQVLEYLRQREQVTQVYLEKSLGLKLADGRSISALGFVVDRHHRQYAGALGAEEAAAHILGSVGLSGRNEDYVLNTLSHLREIGIHDAWMEEVGRKIR